MSPPLISIVSPVFKSEECVEELCRRLKLAIKPITENFEIILVEDRGPDDSWSIIEKETKKDTRIKGIRLARNFGQHRAITAGLDIATGDWVVVMDSDLQDPPEEIPRLYSKACEGFEIVIAEFVERKQSKVRQKLSTFFWNGLSWLSEIPFDYRVGNYRIMSQKVVANFRSYREQLRLVGGITSLMGFTTTTIPVQRAERFTGETSYTYSNLLSIAFEIAMAYSSKPLKLSITFGLFVSGLSIIIGAVVLMFWSTGVIEVPGWASVIVSIYFLGGLIIANLGLIGYYIGKTFDETKKRPLYIVENTTFDSSEVDINPIRNSTGRVIWITGLSGAGKTTLAQEITNTMRATGEKIVILDGDELRGIFTTKASETQNYTRKERLKLAMRYARLSRIIATPGVTVVVATISLFSEIQKWNRSNLPRYFEVYLKVPIDELRRRDPKGIYSRFDSGDLKNVAGLDLPIDEPKSADFVMEFAPDYSVSALAERVIHNIKIKEKKAEKT